MLQTAIDFYHELLHDSAFAEEADVQLRSKLKERSLYFGSRPLCVVLRPHFYTEENWAFLQNSLGTLLSAFAKVHEVCLANADMRRQLRLDPYEEALIPYDKPNVPPWTSSRLDAFYLPEQNILKCVEYNAETPAGIGYDEILCEVFDELDVVKRFQERYHIRSIRSLGTLTDAVIAGYRAWGGVEKPQIAIMDWREVPTLNEHEITRQYFEQNGYTAILADPRHLEYRNGKLWHQNFRIDMIYKRVLFSELIKVMGMNSPVVQAIRDRNVYITNSISAKMLSKKASLAFLSDEQNQHLFSKDQLEAIERFIPWTRVVENRKTTYNGRTVDLLQFAADNRERLALKPNDDYGGTGVLLGWQTPQDAWEQILQSALETPFVVQERVNIVEIMFPMWLNNALDISPRFVDADPYVFGGNSIHGVLTRLSPQALLNVTAGGGSIVPTLIISEK